VYNIGISKEGKVNRRAVELHDAMAAIAIGQQPTYYDRLAEACRLGGKAAFGKEIHNSMMAAEDLAAALFFDALDELEKINNG